MYHRGELVIHHKQGTRKYYGLTEKLLPEPLVNGADPNPTLQDYHDWYVMRRIASIGLLWGRSSDAWLGTDIKKEDRISSLARLLKKNQLIEVTIDGIDELFYLPEEYIELLNDNQKCNEASIIAPLDNFMWDRNMISAIFNFNYRWEVYTPAAKRKYGYYVLPVICGGRFIGRCEPVMDRKRKELVIRNWWWEANIKTDQEMINSLIRCFSAFVRFLGAETITGPKAGSGKKLGWIADCV
jgi:hypothetical protein